MDHSHAADKSIKHYADAKRVPTRKATGGEGLAATAVLPFFFASLSFSSSPLSTGEEWDGNMKGRRFQLRIFVLSI